MTSPYAVPLSDLDATRVPAEQQASGSAEPPPDPTLVFGLVPAFAGGGGSHDSSAGAADGE